MENLEIEYKVMVNGIDFFYLQEKLKEYKPKMFIQENIYYDTVLFQVKNNNLSLRVRHIKNQNKYIVTLKEKLEEGRKEYEFEVSSPKDFPQEIIDKLQEYGIDHNCLEETSRLTTYRNEYYINDSILCLDENHYYGKVDYEIECESTSLRKAKRIIENTLNKYRIAFQESTLSKVARANKYKK